MHELTREQVIGLMNIAGLDVRTIKQIRNQYWIDAPSYPWWLVLTQFGVIMIGWRKRVISIDWELAEVRHIVTEDDVTKSQTYVHAWSLMDAAKYLSELARHAKSTDPVAQP